MAERTSQDKRTPKQGVKGFVCPRCSLYAAQTWYPLQREESDPWGNQRWSLDAYDTPNREQHTDRELEDQPAGAGQWTMARCTSCLDYTVWRDAELIYPAASTIALPPHRDMPPEAATLYREAAAVAGISPRAGAALARATLELLLKTLDPMDGKQDLAKRIDHVLAVVRATSSLGQMLTVIRHSGNKSLHIEEHPDAIMVQILDPEQPGILALIFQSINDLVEELVAQPERVAALFEDVPEDIRKHVGKSYPISNDTQPPR